MTNVQTLRSSNHALPSAVLPEALTRTLALALALTLLLAGPVACDQQVVPLLDTSATDAAPESSAEPGNGATGSLTPSSSPPQTDPVDPTDPTGTPPETHEAIVLARAAEVHLGAFATSQACSSCHANAPHSDAMRDGTGQAIAPFDLWQASMKANAARDPLFRAVLAAERIATPAIAEAIEDKCLTCHAPMLRHHLSREGTAVNLEMLYANDNHAVLGLDGVSCTTCHQLADENLGDPSTFSGNYILNDSRHIYGPHANPFSQPMVRQSGFLPVFSNHMTESALCASCHTLFTDAHRPDGTPTGNALPEQTPYLEWRNSVFTTEGSSPGPEAASCQSCHMPTTGADGLPVVTRIAHRPDGTAFGQIAPREPYGQHLFVGGNTLIPAILRDNADELNPLASRAAFDRTIALALQQLQENTASLELVDVRREGDLLSAELRVINHVGHKFPSAFPSRRAWIHFEVHDADSPLFASGAHDARGRLLDAHGAPLPSERVGGPALPHFTTITEPHHVQVYEAVMADADGNPTMRLMHGDTYLKDNRLLPRGWRNDHPDAEFTRPVATHDDPLFRDGEHRITYRIALPPGTGPVTLEARLLYQLLGERFAAELFELDAPEIRVFRRYWSQADRSPVTVAHTRHTLD